MKNALILTLSAALATTATMALAQTAAPASTPPENAEGLTEAEARKVLEQCGPRKFTARAEYVADGKNRRTGVSLCSAPGDTENMWIAKLEKSAQAIAVNQQIPSAARTTLVTEIHAEIARLRGLQRRSIPAADALVANVPPLPAPLPARPEVVVGQAPPQGAPLLAAPSVEVRCLNEGGPHDRGRDCEGEIRRDTILALESREDMASPATVRFVRKGELREEVRLGVMRTGQLVRMRLPRSVCKGVVRSKLDLEIVTAGENGKPSAPLTEGPYDLRC